MAKRFENSEDSDQMRHSAVPDLGLHCLPITILEVSLHNGLKQNPCQLINCVVLYSKPCYNKIYYNKVPMYSDGSKVLINGLKSCNLQLQKSALSNK